METIRRDNKVKYREMIRVDGRPIKSPCFGRKTDATNWKRRMLNEREQSSASGSNFNPNLTFGTFSRTWLEEVVKIRNSQRTYECYNSDLKNHLLPTLELTLITSISPTSAHKLISALKAKNLTHRTINKVIGLLKTILNFAVKSDYIPKNRLFAFPELKEPPKADVFWEKTEISQFFRANINDNLFPMYLTAIYTGMRLGEILGLCWDRVNFTTKQIEVTRIMTRSGLQETTKTHKKRVISMHPDVQAAFVKLIQAQRSKTFVFTKENGRPLDYNHVSQREFKKAQKRAGFSKVIRFHDLRHTFASQFMMEVGDIYSLQKILGHRSIDQTNRYAHLSTKFLSDAINKLSFDSGVESEPYMNHALKISSNIVSIS